MAAQLPEMACKSIDDDGYGSCLNDDWFTRHTCPMDGEDETGALAHQASALQRYLAGEMSPAAAAASMAEPAPDFPGSPADARDRVLGIVEDALLQLPQRHTAALVLLLKELDGLPGEDESGAPLWKGLKSFGNSWSDSWKQSHWRKALATSSPDTRVRRRQAHLHRALAEASCAVATAADPPGGAESGLLPLSWGYECVSDALECRQGVVWDFEIPAAATWLRVAGARMLEGAKKGEKSWALEREGSLWPPGPMSVERWEYWKTRLQDIESMGHDISEAAGDGLKHVGGTIYVEYSLDQQFARDQGWKCYMSLGQASMTVTGCARRGGPGCTGSGGSCSDGSTGPASGARSCENIL
ncbi:hypothetical protein HIM_11052 [Hirsutella minnesotensis 3608]|uniref:Uncharacterized protein n=1 Tax=Hirsutella minnesotensis 3608 TaxID=1043627 RepID=A0A0F8A1M8_9HYPO|nr:hypothetical protein HIM_11052 [Hirsutella minnesotensis 3608]